ncbi:hypothetical protein [Acidithiobacillus sp.]|jgi:hypothetical protein|uniref:hypothetical protein n=1 Tax=Acidithiobacillus sp. TaxID=1872118 RepID=UPI003CFCAC0F
MPEKVRVTIYLKPDNSEILNWYNEIPSNDRPSMIRMALLYAIRNGFGVENMLATQVESKSEVASSEPHSGVPVIEGKEQQGSNEKKIQDGKSQQAKSVTENPEYKGSDIEGMRQFTVEHLPDDATDEMRRLAAKFPRQTPYTMELLNNLVKMSPMLEEGDS